MSKQDADPDQVRERNFTSLILLDGVTKALAKAVTFSAHRSLDDDGWVGVMAPFPLYAGENPGQETVKSFLDDITPLSESEPTFEDAVGKAVANFLKQSPEGKYPKDWFPEIVPIEDDNSSEGDER